MVWISFGQSNDSKPNQKISDVLERLDIAERRLRSLDLEFSELYGKVRHALGRIEKRAAIIEKSQPEGEPREDESIPLEDSPLEGLTPRQIQLNAMIMAARRRA